MDTNPTDISNGTSDSMNNTPLVSSRSERIKNSNDFLDGMSEPVGPNQPPSMMSTIADNISTTASGVASIAGSLIKTTAENAFNNVKSIAGGITDGVSDIASGNILKGIQGIAGASGAATNIAGNPSSLLSSPGPMTKPKVPPGAEVLIFTNEATKVEVNNAQDWRVKISCDWSLLNNPQLMKPLIESGGVVWPYTPTVTIASEASYSDPGVTHSNYPFHAYQNSAISDITITGDFSAENEDDALYWIAATTFFKTVTKMFFGSGAHVGNPPIICKLHGYGTNIFNNIPVIIKSFSVNMPPDVDYILCTLASGTKNWVPILSDISVTVSPIYNREKLRKFNLQDYADGKLTGSQEGFM